MDQWPDITSAESVWNTTAASSTPAKPAVAVNNQPQVAPSSEATMEQLRQEQAQRLAMASSERAAEEERRTKEIEEKHKLQQQQQQREMEERKRKQEEER